VLFNTVQFAVFFALVTASYYLLPGRSRWTLLLASSCFFYMAFIPAYILILFLTILVDYAAALAIERAQGGRRKAWLAVSVVFTCLILFVFKYYGFFAVNVAALARALDWNYAPKVLGLLLPIGLSFHTFQSLSYVVEVYRGNYRAERHLGYYALYVMFYPQLVAGPIERPQNLIHQLREEHPFDARGVADGLKLMAWGLFKKAVIADRLAILVNQVYDNPRNYTGVPLAAATVFFAFQIFCDFSGYSDMALGAARTLGIRLMTNFSRPYASTSLTEFWSRWHISLSTWFRDYFYISLGGNRRGERRTLVNLFLTFLVSGLWHGANWTFVAWGALNGLYVAVERAVGRAQAAGGRFFRWAVTFALTCLAWVFFRAATLGDAFYILREIFTGGGRTARLLAQGHTAEALRLVKGGGWVLTAPELAASALMVAVLEAVQFAARDGRFLDRLREQPAVVRWCAYEAVVIAVFLLGVFEKTRFVYFQF
jgi:D-alanyl-lipoteichoic acid acyltransferase DltB (MBOAT superfamily)